MRYYKITCHTPFVGEENDYYIKVFNEEELYQQIDECVYETANDWYDEQTLIEQDMDEEEYFESCEVKSVVEISKEEFLEACPWEA